MIARSYILAIALLLAGLAASASANVVNTTRVPVASANDSTTSKTATAVCGSGLKLVGTGFDVIDGNGRVLVNRVRVDSALNSVSVVAREDEEGFGGNWAVNAIAVCAAPPPGLERVAAASVSNSSTKSVTANCPEGKRVLGVGGEVTNSGQILIDDLLAKSDLTGAIFSAREDETGVSGNWSITAYAICANLIPGLQRADAGSPLNSDPIKAATATCPGGKGLLSAGVDVRSPNGQIVVGRMLPNGDLTGAESGGIEDGTGNPDAWSISMRAICAPVATLAKTASGRIAVTTSITSIQICPPRAPRTTGVGAELTNSLGEMRIEDLIPVATGAITKGDVRPPGTARSWELTGFAICSTPPASYSIQQTTSPTNTDVKGVSATCPAGTRVLGAAGSLDGSEDVILNLIPNADLTLVTALGSAASDEPPWSITAYAICGTAPPGLELVTTTTNSDADEIATATATCPASKHLIGTGASVNTGGGRVILDGLRPRADLSNVTATAIEAANIDVLNPWQVTAYAICANR